MRGIVWTNGWRWIFILVGDIPEIHGSGTHANLSDQEGIATVVIAVAAYGFVHNFPDTAKFLSSDERDFIHARLARDSDAVNKEHFSWAAVLDALKDGNCWLYGLGFHTMSLPLYKLSLFLVGTPKQRRLYPSLL